MSNSSDLIKSQSLIVEKASNIGSTSYNPSYDKTTFLEFFPQFTGKLPDSIITNFIGMANSCLPYSRWQDQWSFGMSLFVAHFCYVYLLTLGDANTPAQQVISSCKAAMGIANNKSVGDVSISYDHSYLQNVYSWGTWTLSIYGQQFITLAKLMGKGGMYVW